MQYIDDGFEPLDQLSIASLEFVERPGLFSEYINDRIGTVAGIDLGGEGVITEIFPSFLGIFLQSSIEKSAEGGGRVG
jgi:hypothetical protein